jgi:hypothetical protein
MHNGFLARKRSGNYQAKRKKGGKIPTGLARGTGRRIPQHQHYPPAKRMHDISTQDSYKKRQWRPPSKRKKGEKR